MKTERTNKMHFLKSSMLCLLTVLLACAFLGGCKPDETEDRFDVEMTYGYGNVLEYGKDAPFHISVTNNGDDFEGVVQLIVPTQDGNKMYGKEFSISKGSKKQVELVGSVNRNHDKICVRIVDKKDNVIFTKEVRCNVSQQYSAINVGILSDDYSALGYMDQQQLLFYTELHTEIFELNKDTLPSEKNALEMLDVIVISDFSTDTLSDEQLKAIGVWVSEGGLLMVGTGSTHNKTLSKLNGNLLDITVGSLEKKNTKFGLTLADFNGLATQAGASLQTYADPYSDYNYNSFFEGYFTDNYDSLKQAYADSYKADWDGDVNTDYDAASLYGSFYYYCYEKYYYDVYIPTIYSGLFQVSGTDALPYVNADVLSLSGALPSNPTTEIYWGETAGDPYELAYVSKVGFGHTVVAGIDFTKNPLPNYEGNSLLFIYFLEKYVGSRCYEDYSNGSYYYYDDPAKSLKSSLADGLAAAHVPPVLLYGLLIVIFLITVIVFYFIMLKKKKSIRLWFWYPVLALGFGIIIYCLGFSTRLFRPVINSVSFVTPYGSMTSRLTALSVTVPRNKEYKIAFPKDSNISFYEEYDYWYGSDDENIYDTYEVGLVSGYEDSMVYFNDMTALESRTMMLSDAYVASSGIDISYNGWDYSVTNHYDCDLEAAFFYYDGKLYYIGDFAKGETKTLTEYEYSGYYSVVSDIRSEYTSENIAKEIGCFFLGSILPVFDDFYVANQALSAYDDLFYNVSQNDEFIFGGVCTQESVDEFQSSTNYRERSVELIYIQDNVNSIIQKAGN